MRTIPSLGRHHGRVARNEPDEINQALADLEAELGETADVSRETLKYGIVMVDVTPPNQDALSMNWLVMKDEIVFHAGHQGGRWELAKTVESIAWMGRVGRAITRGRVREPSDRIGPGWT